MAFTNTVNDGLELWVLDIQSARAKKIFSKKLNASLGNPISWLADSKSILVKVLPENYELIDAKKEIPTAALVSVYDGSVSQNRTYQYLLKNQTEDNQY